MKRADWTTWRSPGHRLVVEIVRASERLTKAADRFLQPWGLTIAQFNVLALLASSPSGLKQSEIGSRLVVTRANVTGLVRRLSARGLCRVEARADDARAKIVRITAGGSKLMARIERPWFGRIDGTARALPIPLQRRLADAAALLEPAPDRP